jgi:hypothetical protein
MSMYEFERFANKQGFNNALGHFQSVSELLGYLEDKENLADILSDFVEDGELENHQLNPIVFAILVDKFGYSTKSLNLENNIDDFSPLISEVSKWKAVDLLFGYHHPELGFTAINPKNEDHFKSIGSMKKFELLTLYGGMFDKDIDEKKVGKAFSVIEKFFSSGKISSTDDLKQGSFSHKKKKAPSPKPAAKKAKKAGAAKTSKKSAPSRVSKTVEEKAGEQSSSGTGKRRMTPMYSVPVTNELFHNGNVEAWKKIIESYKMSYPSSDVYVFYDGERIHDINTLFKWGKVKHGSAILFAVAGEEIKDVAKLQRYLRQGASPKFEDFLRFPVNTVLKLF